MLTEKQCAEVSRVCKGTKRVSRICSFLSFMTLILQYDVECVDDARNVTCWRYVRKRECQGPSEPRGNIPSMVRRMFIKRSAPQPRSKKTPSGGRIMAKMILMISLRSGLV